MQKIILPYHGESSEKMDVNIFIKCWLLCKWAEQWQSESNRGQSYIGRHNFSSAWLILREAKLYIMTFVIQGGWRRYWATQTWIHWTHFLSLSTKIKVWGGGDMKFEAQDVAIANQLFMIFKTPWSRTKWWYLFGPVLRMGTESVPFTSVSPAHGTQTHCRKYLMDYVKWMNYKWVLDFRQDIQSR